MKRRFIHKLSDPVNLSTGDVRKFFRYWLVSGTIISFAAVATGFLLQGVVLIYTIIGIFITYVSIFLTRKLWYGLKDLSPSKVAVRLFWIALLIRLIAVPLLAWIFVIHTGVPFESGPLKDDFVYNEVSKAMAELWRSGDWRLPSDMPFVRGNYSGWPIFAALIMFITYPTFWVARIANAILGAGVVVFLYRISLKCFANRSMSSLVGAIALTSPVLIYYSATQHKDMLLLFLGTFAILCILNVLRGSYGLSDLIAIVICLTVVLFVRSGYAALILFCSGLVLLATFSWKLLLLRRVKRKWMHATIVLTLLVMVFFSLWNFLSEGNAVSSLRAYYKSHVANVSIVSGRSIIGKTSYAEYLGYPLYAAGSLFVPVATVVELPLDTVGGALFRPAYYTIGNGLGIMSLAPFCVVGLITFLLQRKKWKLLLLPVFILVGYKLILANSYQILADRQSLPAIIMSFLIVPLSIFLVIQKRKTGWFWLFVAIQVVALVLFNYIRVEVRL